MPARLLIVDDHEVMRVGVRALLKGNPEIEVCGEANSGLDAVVQTAKLAPDVVLLDISLPDVGGTDVAEEIRRIAPSAKIILFSMHELPMTPQSVGADAFVAKSDAAKTLTSTVAQILDRRAS
jgi:DNA-binding NarL/FixJ family response regulator